MEDVFDITIVVKLNKHRKVVQGQSQGGLALIATTTAQWTSMGSTPDDAFHKAAGEGFEDFVRNLPKVVVPPGGLIAMPNKGD
jgi:hypothetical protein